jgi:hypothetical protein
VRNDKKPPARAYRLLVVWSLVGEDAVKRSILRDGKANYRYSLVAQRPRLEEIVTYNQRQHEPAFLDSEAESRREIYLADLPRMAKLAGIERLAIHDRLLLWVQRQSVNVVASAVAKHHGCVCRI